MSPAAVHETEPIPSAEEPKKVTEVDAGIAAVCVAKLFSVSFGIMSYGSRLPIFFIL